MPHPDTWLFLPPEVEALVPSLLARLAADGGGSPDRVEQEERYRIETLILEGDAEQWRTFLREATTMVAEYAGEDVDARKLLADILDDQFLLARAVIDFELADIDARQQLAQAGADTAPGEPRRLIGC